MKRFKKLLLITAALGSIKMTAQDNCLHFKALQDTCRYQACTYLENAPTHFQLSRAYHVIKDKAIEICPEYAIVYRHKSTAYLKTGDFITWKILIDKAVDLNPRENLDYRAWGKFQFFRDYKGAIEDIAKLEKTTDHDIGYSQNGDYHLNIVKALCFKKLDQPAKAIQIINSQIERSPSTIGLYDFLHLGVLYLEMGAFDQSLAAFKKQLQLNEIAEVYYYMALASRAMNDQEDTILHLQKAKKLYLSANHMMDIYTHPVDKVFLQDIENELNKN